MVQCGNQEVSSCLKPQSLKYPGHLPDPELTPYSTSINDLISQRDECPSLQPASPSKTQWHCNPRITVSSIKGWPIASLLQCPPPHIMRGIFWWFLKLANIESGINKNCEMKINRQKQVPCYSLDTTVSQASQHRLASSSLCICTASSHFWAAASNCFLPFLDSMSDGCV